MSSTEVSAANKMQLIKGERHIFASSDDNAVMKQILATHSPDGREVKMRPLLCVVEDILQRATPTVVVTSMQASMEVVEDKMHHTEIHGMLEALAYTIHRLSCEIVCKCSGGGDARATTLALFHTLSNYTWEAKLVLVLSAFAVSYGEFCLTAQLHTVNPLAKSVALLKQLPDILQHTGVLKPRFDAINHLIKAMLDVTNCIIEFKELPSQYISPDSPGMSTATAHIPTAVYWTVRSIIACASQIFALIGLGHEYISSTTEAWELSSLAHKVNNIHGHLRKQLDLCNQHIDERRRDEVYNTLVHLFKTPHSDNMQILNALHSKEDLPLIDGSTKKRVGVDVLRRKIVMLLISDLDISHEELLVLIQIYIDKHPGKMARNYEIVWMPVIDRHVPWLPAREEAFNRLASTMPWYTAYHSALVKLPVSKYIRDAWRFDKKPMLVVLDPQDKVVCPNALHMMWIWGNRAFPFTSNREEALWEEETWRLEFLVDEIDPAILAWAREGRYVCLYGGENIDWIRMFTTLLRRVSQEAGIPLEMVYVGKSNSKERVKKAINVISAEKLSGYLQDPAMQWFFWVRLESMWHSKMQHGRTIDDDPIMQEVMTMLTFDGGDEGWALISRGSLEMVKANGKKMVDCLTQFDAWKSNVETEGFVPALTNALAPFHSPEHCTRLILPADTGMIKEKVVCAECRRPMEEFVLYRCCNN